MSYEADPKETNSLGDKKRYMIGTANTGSVPTNLHDCARFISTSSTRPSHEMLICAEYTVKVAAIK